MEAIPKVYIDRCENSPCNMSEEMMDFAISSFGRIKRLTLLRDLEIIVGKKLEIKMSNGPTRAIDFISVYTNEKTPSMRLWSNSCFRCFSSGEEGIWIDLVSEFFECSGEQHLMSLCSRYVRKVVDKNKQLPLF
jgi:hypothetical protein